MLIAFCLPAALLIYLSFKSFRGGVAYLRYVRGELAKPCSSFMPFVSVIAPCKGLDEGMEQNLRTLLEQDFPAYEVIFVVDDEDDPAVRVIKSISHKDMDRVRLVIAPKAVESAQKVENLREAVLYVSDESRVFVFADSDARPPKDWLRSLVASLENERVGAATGYRWFISPKPSFASELRSAWNASIASALGPNSGTNFCWGGSTAIRRDLFDQLDIRAKWKGTLSDDFTLTKAVKEANLKIHFVPRALIPSIENCTFSELLEFTTRQMKITRVYAPTLWLLSFIGSGLFNVTMIWAIWIMIVNSPVNISFWIAAVTVLLVSVFSIGKSWIRLKAVRLVMTEHAGKLEKQFWPQNMLWLLAPALFLYNSIAALLSRQMTWRRTRYELVSATETRIISRIQN